MQIETSDGQIPVKKSRRDVGCQLIKQIGVLVGPGYIVQMVRERSWASITFSGTRHSVAIQPLKEAGKEKTVLPSSFAAQIGTHEFDLPGHYVADVLVDDCKLHSDVFMAEILTIIDPVAAKISRI